MAPEIDVKIETDRLNASFTQLANATGKSFGTIVLQNARLVAWNLAHNTLPYGMSLASRKLMDAAVAVDIGKIYKSASYIYGLLKAQDAKQAKAWYRAIQDGNYTLASELLAKTSLSDRGAYIGKLDRGFHRNTRRGNSISQTAQIVPSTREIKSYTKEIQQHVGFGKAGWITAGSDLGRVTRVPGWITRHVGKAPGSAINNTKGIDPHVVLTNSVSYISTICPPHQVANSLAYQREKMDAHIQHVLAAEAEKAGFIFTGSRGTSLNAAA